MIAAWNQWQRVPGIVNLAPAKLNVAVPLMREIEDQHHRVGIGPPKCIERRGTAVEQDLARWQVCRRVKDLRVICRWRLTATLNRRRIVKRASARVVDLRRK